MSPTSDAYVLVTIPNATLTSSSTGTLTGQLVLEYVTYEVPSTAQVTQNVLLVLVLRNSNAVLFEAPLDPARTLSVSSLPSSFGVARQRYIFQATRDDTEFTVEIPKNNNNATDDMELFHSVLIGYATDVRINGEQIQSSAGGVPGVPPSTAAAAAAPVVAEADEDLRGRFVFMNEDDGEIVGTLDRSVRVFEDPSLQETGHEKDTLVVEVPEGADIQNGGLSEEEVLVSTIPPEERDWMLNTAVFVSHAISGTTTLLTSAMAGASNMYIAHSTPSTTPGSTTAASPRPTTPSSASQSKGQGHADPLASAPAPAPPPSRTLLLLQSPTTRKSLTQIHAVSGSAAKLSSKAATTVDWLIQRAIGDGSSSTSTSTSTGTSTNSSADKGKGKGKASSSDTVKSPTPQLPPRAQVQTQAQQAPITATAPGSGPPLRTRTRVALSAALILASIEASALRLVESGGSAVTAAVTHKYGTTAGENAALAGRTARNIVLVYVDMRGLGRRVIVKRMAKTWVKGHIASARREAAASG